jgi:hypothetical protein
MHANLGSNWAGSFSIAWMLVGYLLIRFVTTPLRLQFEPFWLYFATLFCAWLGVGLWIAIVGLRSRSIAGRASAVFAIVLFAFFTWHMLYPALKPAHLRASWWPNHPASGNGAITSLFHIQHLGRAVPEQYLQLRI